MSFNAPSHNASPKTSASTKTKPSEPTGTTARPRPSADTPSYWMRSWEMDTVANATRESRRAKS